MPKPPSFKGKSSGSGAKPKFCPSSTSECKSTLDPLENFEIELLWCIQQLESSLQSKKVNPRLAEDTVKNINTLKSNKAPLIKKRQIMRSLFGDYRAKMAEEEKKYYKANSNVKFTNALKERAQFLKKASSCQSSDISRETCLSVDSIGERKENDEKRESFSFKPSDNSFRFNFDN